jgi:V/A-type H+-transporting ATPase subunit I
MFTKCDIRRVSIVIPAVRYSELIVSLGRSGLLHLDRGNAAQIPALEYGLKNRGLSSVSETAGLIVSAAEDFFSEEGVTAETEIAGGSVADDLPSLFRRDAGEDLRDVRRIVSSRDKFKKAEAAIEKRIISLEKQLDDLGIIREDNIDFLPLNSLKYASYFYGTVNSDNCLHEMKGSWFHIMKGNRLLVMFPSFDREDVLRILKTEGFAESSVIDDFLLPGDAFELNLKKRLGILKGRLERLHQLYDSSREKLLERLLYLSEVYRIILKISGAESDLLSTDELVVISGWINFADAESLKSLLGEGSGESYFVQIASVKENRSFQGRIPVLLKNIKIFKPFELLVKMMGTPGNSEVDPTPAAAIAYTVIFGVMFGDLGQGLTIAAAGLFLLRYGRRKYGERNNISDFGGIMTWCGLSAAVFGILYGSVFSYEHLIPAVLFHPMENMMELFLMAIMAGVIFISAGLVFNMVNGLFSGHYEEAFFGTKGGCGLAVYLSVIYFVMRYVAGGELPGAAVIAALFLPPSFLFLLRGPLGYIFFHGETLFPHGLFEYIVESIVEIIEMFSGFLGNTISYIRAGAFALSHAGLSIAVFTLAEIIDPSMKSIGAITAIVTGNIFIMLLEGLVCSIQSMRLEYYEFFSKFFKGDGTAFTPFSLKLR